MIGGRHAWNGQRLYCSLPATKLRQDDACETWGTVRPWIEDACEHGDGWWTVEKLIPLLCEGRAVLWVLEDAGTPIAAVVTAIADWDGVRAAEIIATGGSGVIDALSAELPKIENWAREHGASECLFRGRRGWSRSNRGVWQS